VTLLGLLTIASASPINLRRTKSTICVPAEIIQGAVAPSLNLETSQRVVAEILYGSGLFIPRTEPFGNTFYFNGVSANVRARYDQSDRLIRLAQVIQNRATFNPSTRVLSREQFIDWLEDQSDCPPVAMNVMCTPQPQITCPFDKPYRNVDGTCNNLLRPYLGSAETPYSRLLPALYEDDIHAIKRGVSGNELPQPRIIATKLFENSAPPPTPPSGVIPNSGSIFYAQMIVHDFAGAREKSTAQSGPGTQCCTADRSKVLSPELTSSVCQAIRVPEDDAFYSQHQVACLNFLRSFTIPTENCEITAAQQSNTITHFIDGSFVYGSSEAQLNSFRSFVGGQFILSNNVLPPSATGGFTAGDGRVGQTPNLVVYHSVYYREHNRVASALSVINPAWDDERLFQEARRIVIAQIQHSTYDELLPVFIGEDAAQNEGLLCRGTGYCDCYSAGVDPSCINEYTTGPSRLLHFFVPNLINSISAAGVTTERQLSSIFGQGALANTEYTPILRGMLQQGMKMAGGFPFQLLNLMFRGTTPAGLDLLSADINRGRDHGIPSYASIREYCGLGAVNSFEDLAPLISAENIEKLRELYDDARDIDLIVGAGIENYDGFVTPTSRCLHVEQHKRFMCGDRYFYTSSTSPRPFTLAQLNALKADTFARLLCQNTDITSAPANAFLTSGPGNPEVLCSSVSNLDLTLWRE
jgi:peroxidase